MTVADANAKMALISALADGAKAKPLGRTALVKLCYFLQTLRRVPLGYQFTLYSYGPFDSDVLADLNAAEAVGLVNSSMVTYPGGYGYAILPGKQARRARILAGDFLRKYSEDIDWVISVFSGYSASDLELLSTILYVDREAALRGRTLGKHSLVSRVKDVKPHFIDTYIADKASYLESGGFLRSLSSSGK